MSWRKVVVAVALVLVAVVVAAVLWVRSLFREPGALTVPSLTARLGAHSILAVFPHPDDEIKAAGLIADATRRGVVVRMITATRGDHGIASASYPRAELPRIREAEVRRHGAALGVRDQEVWAYGDSQLPHVERELADRLAARIRAWHPDTIVTFDPGGGFSAHPDHLALARAVTAAFCAVDGPDAPRRLVYAVAPRRVARRLGGARGRIVATREPAPQFRVAVDAAIKVRGWRFHASQADYVRRFAHVPPWLLYRLFDREELYAVFDRARCGGATRAETSPPAAPASGRPAR